jgi:hypothetical protein
MGDTGQAISGALYVASNIYSWKQAKDMPKLQADANRKVLEMQKRDYDAISETQRGILRASLTTYLNDVDTLLGGGDFENAFPDVAEAAAYVPVDACCIQNATIECNIGATNRTDDYVRHVNRLHEQNDLIHALSFCPDFLINLDILNKSAQRMMRGLLDTGDVVEILTDNSEQAALYGRIGNTRRTTARDFGVSKMRVQAAGRREFRENTAWINSVVSPMQRQGDIRSMAQTPQERVSLALAQAQLIQNSLQNKNNQLSMKSPFLMAQLQLKMQRMIQQLQTKSSEALLVNTHVPDYSAIVFPKLSNTAQLLGGIGSAVSAATSSHFWGAPNQAQDGFGQAQNSQRREPGGSSGSKGGMF